MSTETTVRRFCDRCGVEAGLNEYRDWSRLPKRERNQEGPMHNGDREWFARDLCRDCARSFDEWWAAPNAPRTLVPPETP